VDAPSAFRQGVSRPPARGTRGLSESDSQARTRAHTVPQWAVTQARLALAEPRDMSAMAVPLTRTGRRCGTVCVLLGARACLTEEARRLSMSSTSVGEEEGVLVDEV